MNSSVRSGGAILLVASLLLVVATILEAPLLSDPTDGSALFWIYFVVFIVSAVGLAIAGGVLAFRARIVAGSTLGRVGLFGFGILWLVSQALYVVGQYFSPSETTLTVSLVIDILMIIALLVGSIVVASRHVLAGVARWSLLVAAIISAVTGGVAGGLTSAAAVTVLHLISALGLAVAGATYVGARAADRATAPVS